MTNCARDVAIFLSQKVSRHWDGFGFFDLHRLLYLAQGWHIASRHGLLFRDAIEAHHAAPMTRSVTGCIPLDQMLPLPRLSPDAREFLEQFCNSFARADRGAIRRQVEREYGAWWQTLTNCGDGAEIEPVHMMSCFRMMLMEFKSFQRGEGMLRTEWGREERDQSGYGNGTYSSLERGSYRHDARQAVHLH